MVDTNKGAPFVLKCRWLYFGHTGFMITAK